MRVRHVKLAIVGSILSLLFPASASALPAEQAVGFQFTFNPSLAITLSSDELVVSNLLPGNYASSNTITIDVQTNNHSGYTLTAAVGDSEVPTLANSNLVNTAVNGATFTSLASNASLTLANFGSNYWGYTTTQSLSDSSLYSGLTYGTATTLNQTVDPSGKSVNGYYGGNTTDFTIGVNAGADQVSGEYTNIISFAIVPNISTDFIIESLKYLQDFTELADDELVSVINSMAAGQSYQLIDARDGEIYNIAKLADGKVWLQDNLALDLTDSTVLNNLTTSNTNASAASLTSLRSGNRSAGDQYATAGVANWASGYSYSAPLIATSGAGNLGDWTKDTTQPLAMGQSGTGKIGVYYNFCAASAGSYCYGDGTSAGTSSGNAIEDVCPASWRMPTGGASGEYQALYTAYSNSGADFVNALKLPLSGYFDSGLAYIQGSAGYFLSSTHSDNSNIYNLRIITSSISPQNSSQRDSGLSIRCLLDPATPYTIYYDKNTTDTVSDLPSTWNGTINTVRRPTLSTATPTRSNYNFIGWCDTLPTTSGDTDTCSGTTYTPGSELPASGNSSTVYAMWIKTFVQTTEVRYENADGTWGSYNTVDTQTLNSGSSYSWSTAQITNFDSAAYQAASVSSYTVTEAHTNQVSIYRNTFTCTKQYRLEAGNGDWGNYDPDGTIENVRYGSTCSYTKDVDYYTSQTASVDNVTSNQTLSVSLPRTTYSLTVSAGSNTSKPTGSGTYRWGQAVSVSVTKNTDITCTSYSTPTWTATAGTAPAAGASTSFTMPTSNATITATSTASNVAQTITLSRSGGASGINIGGTNYTGSSVSLTCGTYNISGNYSSGYEFSSWSRSGSVTVANTSSASTTMTVSGSGTLTLAGKQSCVSTISGYMQNISSTTNYCTGATGTVTDSRDGTSYTVGKLADGKIWLLDNLRLDLTNSTVKNNLTASTTNASATTLNYLKNGGGTTSDKYATAGVANWASSNNYSAPLIATSGTGNNGSWTKDTLQSYGSGSGKIGVYYNYCAASAGSYCYGNGTSEGTPSGNATEDICPKGWRMPTGGTNGEYKALYTAYYSNDTNFKNALRAPLSGYFINGSADDQGSKGHFWSSTYEYSFDMYSLNVHEYVYPQSFNLRIDGCSVRCVLQ